MAVSEDGKRHLPDMYEPLITDSERLATVLGVAQTLWELGEFERAAPLYERYKTLSTADEQAFGDARHRLPYRLD